MKTDRLQTLEAFDRDYAAKRKKLEQELEVASMLPDLGFPWSIYQAPLYGSHGTLRIEQPYRSYGDKPTPTYCTLHAMADAFPAIPLLRLKGTYVSFIPQENLAAYEKQSRSNIKSQENLAPWTIKGESYSREGKLTLEWFSKLPNGQIWEMNFELPSYKPFLHWFAKSKSYMGGKNYTEWGITIDTNKLHDIYSATDSGRLVAQLGIGTRYASGDTSSAPGSYIACWQPVDDPCRATVLDFAHALTLADANK